MNLILIFLHIVKITNLLITIIIILLMLVIDGVHTPVTTYKYFKDIDMAII